MESNETIVTINLKNLEENAKNICEKYKDYKYKIAVLKSNAYGHGYKIVNSIIKGGINAVAVSYISEAKEIRKLNKEIPIICMQPISLNDIDYASSENISVTIHSLDYLKKFNKKVKKNLCIHIKLDTGMNRLGFKDELSLKEAIDIINKNKLIEIEGVFTHFATTGIFDKLWDNQVEKFKSLTKDIDLSKIKMVHLYSSTSLLDHKKLPFANAFRVGIALYGYNVSPSFSKKGLKNKLRNIRNNYLRKKYNISPVNYDVDINLRRAMFMKTHLLDIKKVNAGEGIGYGGKKAETDEFVGILPIGYSNGIGTNPNRFVLINGKRYNMVGSMSMNMMMIKVDETVSIDDEVVILGDEITLGVMSRFNGKQISETLLDIGNNNIKTYEEEKIWE